MQDIQTNRPTNNNVIFQNRNVNNNNNDPYRSYQVQNELKQGGMGSTIMILSLVGTLALISVLFFLFSYVFNSATINIVPVRKDVSINETYIIENEEKEELISTKVLPVSEEITMPKKVKKSVNSRAEGELTIYNDTATPQKFIKNTRFETESGKTFRIQDGVTVPAKFGSKKGSLVAKVVAEAAGEEYNIGPSKFSVPGLKGSPKFKSFSAENSETFGGGSSGNQNGVSELDIEKAKIEVKEKNVAYLNKELSKDVPETFSFSKDSLIIVNGKFEKLKDDDDTATYKQNATGTAIYFNKNKIVARVLEKTQNEGSSNGTVDVKDVESFNISILDPNDLLEPNKAIRIVLSGNAPVVFKPNKDNIIEYYAGKSDKEFEEIVNKFPFIQTAKKTLRPFWANKFPTDVAKISVEFEE